MKRLKQKMISMIFLLTIITLNTGCTVGLWEEVERSKKTYLTYEKVGDENIIAFAQTKKDTGNISKGSLIMIGESYWYVMSPDESTSELLAILRTDLPKRFGFFPSTSDKNEQRAANAAKKGTLPISLGKNGYFSTEFCLSYQAENEEDTEKLKALNFTQGGGNCLNIYGKFYQPASIPTEYRFETPIPVSLLQITSSTTSADPFTTAKAIIATPFTLPVDIVGGLLFVGGLGLGLIDMKLM